MRPIKPERVRREGVLMTGPSATTYTVAEEVGVNQSTVWRDVTNHLWKVDYDLWVRVQRVLETNRRNVKRVSMDNMGPSRYNRGENP